MAGYIPDRFTATDDHEPQVASTIAEALRRHNGAILDVGANIGQTLVKVMQSFPTRRYVGFEPQIACCFYIDQFLRRNGLHHAQVLPFGLSDTQSFLTLRARSGTDECATAAGDLAILQEATTTTTIPVMVGDEVVDSLGIDSVALIKVDVEGLELPVLRGLTQTIERYRPAVLFEVLPNFTGAERTPVDPLTACRRTEEARQLESFFANRDYAIEQIHPNGERTTVSSFELDAPMAFVGINYLASPRQPH
jgi:FkbM family methyltransferase